MKINEITIIDAYDDEEDQIEYAWEIKKDSVTYKSTISHYSLYSVGNLFFILDYNGPVGLFKLSSIDNMIRITNIVLLPEDQGKGLGIEIYKWILSYFKKPIISDTDQTLKTKNLYKKLIFKEKITAYINKISSTTQIKSLEDFEQGYSNNNLIILSTKV